MNAITKTIKIGGSNFLILPSEYINLYDLNKFVFKISYDDTTKTITYKKCGDRKVISKDGIEVKGGNK